MTSKQWDHQDSWTAYAACGGDSRFLTPPDKLSRDDAEQTEYICRAICPVKPECIKAALQNNSSGVWVAGVFIPEVTIDMTRKEANATLNEAERIRHELATTYEGEVQRRGEF